MGVCVYQRGSSFVCFIIHKRDRDREREREMKMEMQAPPPMQATEAQMKEAKLSVAMRDYCAHLLIPLNECRHRNYYLPWKCEHERHDYETCEYKEYMRRMHNQKVKQMMEEERE